MLNVMLLLRAYGYSVHLHTPIQSADDRISAHASFLRVVY